MRSKLLISKLSLVACFVLGGSSVCATLYAQEHQQAQHAQPPPQAQHPQPPPQEQHPQPPPQAQHPQPPPQAQHPQPPPQEQHAQPPPQEQHAQPPPQAQHPPEGRPEQQAEPQGRPQQQHPPEGQPQAEPQGRPQQQHPPEGRPQGAAERPHQVRMLPPRSVIHGHAGWSHWNHPVFVRPLYSWDWDAVQTVTCVAQDSSGNQYPVIEQTSPGFDLAQMSGVEDDALDRCYTESGQDPACTLVDCSHE